MGDMIKINADSLMDAYLVKPSIEPKGAIIVIHEIWGLVDHTKSVADRFSEQGYIALAPSLLFDLDLSDIDVNEIQQELFDPKRSAAAQPKLAKIMAPMQDPTFFTKTANRVQACFDYLYDLPEAKQKVAVTGFCFGGTYSFALAVNEPKLKVAFPFYGHANQTVEELSKIKCPIQAFYGRNDDRLIGGLDDLRSKMAEAKVDFQAKVYEDCAHAFFNDTNPYSYNKEAAQDSWKIIIEKLSELMP